MDDLSARDIQEYLELAVRALHSAYGLDAA